MDWQDSIAYGKSMSLGQTLCSSAQPLLDFIQFQTCIALATAKSAKWQVDDISTEIFLALDHVPQRYMADKTNKLYHMYEDATSADGNKELLWMETKTGVIAI